jgi:hypothetical protein
MTPIMPSMSVLPARLIAPGRFCMEMTLSMSGASDGAPQKMTWALSFSVKASASFAK